MARRNFATVDALLILACIVIFAGGAARAERSILDVGAASHQRRRRQAMKRRRLSLGWIDFLVIAATILTFAAVAGATIGHS